MNPATSAAVSSRKYGRRWKSALSDEAMLPGVSAPETSVPEAAAPAVSTTVPSATMPRQKMPKSSAGARSAGAGRLYRSGKTNMGAISSPLLRRLNERLKETAAEARGSCIERLSGVPLVHSIWHSKSGFKNVTYNGQPRAAKKPWQAMDDYGNSLGMFASAEEAAAAYSNSLGLQVAEELAATVQQVRKPMSNADALRTAKREKLKLRPSKEGCSTPFRGVFRCRASGSAPRNFIAKAHHKGKRFSLGCFSCAEEAALELARFYRQHA